MHSFPQLTRSTLRGEFALVGTIFRGEIFLGGNYPRGQLSGGQFSLGEIVRGTIIRGASIQRHLSGGQFSSGAIVLEPLLSRIFFYNFGRSAEVVFLKSLIPDNSNTSYTFLIYLSFYMFI